MTEIARPLHMQFDGLDADENKCDAIQLGKSIQGAARIYRSTYHFYFVGELPTRVVKADVRVLVGPPQEGTLSYLLWVMLTHGRLAVYPQLLAEFADICVPEFVKAAIAKRGGQTRLAEQAMEKVHDISKDNVEITKRVIDFAEKVEGNRHAEHASLMSSIETLVEAVGQNNASSIISMVEPVGKSVRHLTHAKEQAAELLIDEPTAAVIRSKGDLEVQEMTSMKVRIEAVDRISRTCKIIAEELPKPLNGKISDPALQAPHNVYTHALDNQSEIIVSGKPVLKDGELHTFYISDAKPSGD